MRFFDYNIKYSHTDRTSHARVYKVMHKGAHIGEMVRTAYAHHIWQLITHDGDFYIEARRAGTARRLAIETLISIRHGGGHGH